MVYSLHFDMQSVRPGIESPILFLLRVGERQGLIAQGSPPKVRGGIYVLAFAVDDESR